MPGERCDESIGDRLVPELEDECPHLALSARVSALRSRSAPGRVHRPCSSSWRDRALFRAVRVCSIVENSAWETESCSSRAIRWRSSSARSPSRIRAATKSEVDLLRSDDDGAQERAS